jgi:hypothetical protein
MKNLIKNLFLGKQCPHCKVRGHVETRTNGWFWYDYCNWCFKRSNER